LPDPDESIVDTATFLSLQGGGGKITLEGYVSDPEVIKEMESDIRDEQHQVTGSGTYYDERKQELRWGFREEIVVLPETREESGENE
jgi:hypothetical protein